MRAVWIGILACGTMLCVATLAAQTRSGALSDREVDQIRESRLIPADSILLFVKFLNDRADRITALYAKARRPGREEDTHDLLEQFTSIADELDDNLEDYGPRHADLRAALPKLIEAADRWATQIKTPPDNDAYSISRRIALESVRDLKDVAAQMNTDQQAWFKAHPPAKQKAQQQENDVITIPR
jgi:hypothetical protein